MSLIVTTIGAVLTTLLGVLAGGVLASRSQRNQWSRDRKADACAQVLRESSNMLIELSALDGRRFNPDPGEEPGPSRLDWRPWNEALAMVCLVADHEIVEAAQAIDAKFWPVHTQIKKGLTSEGEWFALRDLIEASRQDFVNITRRHLAPSGPPLRRLTARPPASDPIWQPRRP